MPLACWDRLICSAIQTKPLKFLQCKPISIMMINAVVILRLLYTHHTAVLHQMAWGQFIIVTLHQIVLTQKYHCSQNAVLGSQLYCAYIRNVLVVRDDCTGETAFVLCRSQSRCQHMSYKALMTMTNCKNGNLVSCHTLGNL